MYVERAVSAGGIAREQNEKAGRESTLVGLRFLRVGGQVNFFASETAGNGASWGHESIGAAQWQN